MKLLYIILLLSVSACSGQPNAIEQTQTSFVLTNVNIIDVGGQTIHRSKNISVSNGMIESISDSDTLKNTPVRMVIDGAGGYVTPGLIDMHVHMYEKAAYVLTLSHGVTHVRVMNGVPEQLVWRDKINSGDLIGSTSTVSSPIISGYMSAHLHHGVATGEQARSAVRQYHADGYDLIKAYGNLSVQSLEHLIDEAQSLQMPVAKHGPHGSGNMHVSVLNGLQSFEHVEDIFQGPLQYQFDEERLGPVIADIKKTGVPITPTLNVYEQLTRLSRDKDNFLNEIPTDYTSDIIAWEASRNQVKRWLNASEKMADHNEKVLAFLKLITKFLQQDGVPLLVGSDSGVLLSPHGLATHNEMRLLQRSGLTTYEVLAAATVNPAKALKLEKQLGKIEAGYRADFLYSQANPIDDLAVLAEPKAVVKSGRWYSREQLETMRNNAIEGRSLWQELSVLIDAI
ncbi:amidohydrolase family protein [Neiella marina]|uniref:Amidohydrolase family protein n=1 Tax=Neiella holothuriorum TaxID=2870530 RepID=A0ABS7EHE1_9GAMM|nr:amidohydrolase family protein [Neiella holothuriorum]MBW8191757.1 amidohydrolase family protein [Neiella holothuriorum]